jgi:hypothetical protein
LPDRLVDRASVEQLLDPRSPRPRVARVGAVAALSRLPRQLGLVQLGVAPRQQDVDLRLERGAPRHGRLQGREDLLGPEEFLAIDVVIRREVLGEGARRALPLHRVDLQHEPVGIAAVGQEHG